ncbi:MAG: hypothetical protein R3A12_11690 [Ignavibacteria bacterium]
MSSQNFVGWVGSLNTAGRFVINGARTAPHPKIAMRITVTVLTEETLFSFTQPTTLPETVTSRDVWSVIFNRSGCTWSAANRINDNATLKQSDQWFLRSPV